MFFDVLEKQYSTHVQVRDRYRDHGFGSHVPVRDRYIDHGFGSHVQVRDRYIDLGFGSHVVLVSLRSILRRLGVIT